MRGPQQSPMHGDCRQLLALQPDNHYHFCVTDNPYGLTEMTKRFGGEEAKPAQYGTDGAFARVSAGFMGQAWDGTQIEIDPEFWRLLHKKMRPGAHLLAFGGSRTFHRIAVAIEDAGFVLRDTIQVLGWTYATGMPHSENLREGEWDGYGSGLCPSWEAVLLFRKPLGKGLSIERNCNEWGCGALNIDGCRTSGGEIPKTDGARTRGYRAQMTQNFEAGHRNADYYAEREAPTYDAHPDGRWPKNTVLLHHPLCERIAESLPPRRLTAVMTPNDHGLHRQQNSDEKAQFKYERGEDEWECHPDCRIGSTFNKSAGCFPQFSTIIDPGEGFTPILYTKKPGKAEKEAGLDDLEPLMVRRTNPGGLENEPRWAPVSKKNTHPTVKGLELMRWLIRLASPPPECEPIGVDPFMGSGTTLCAAAYEGVSMDGMEQDARSHRIAIGRINHHEAIAAAKRPTPPPLIEAPKIKRELVRRPMVRAREREAA